MTVLIDNCLPISWVEFLKRNGYVARHWREVGPPNAPDSDLIRWARENNAVVLTQDLDFTKLLFQSGTDLPSGFNSGSTTCARRISAKMFSRC